ncbi:hypothetical protein HMPREF1051_0793 [Neisseria sicca VK64]|uniref:Uncharacterized protein n=1 Tax=Neisseria sicca VK64 TaxID=1095748 RepID=I2NI61_NEISI|nr:hypothetical protein HMPREF1051_0793 [Neisseria sicca VK64]
MIVKGRLKTWAFRRPFCIGLTSIGSHEMWFSLPIIFLYL